LAATAAWAPGREARFVVGAIFNVGSGAKKVPLQPRSSPPAHWQVGTEPTRKASAASVAGGGRQLPQASGLTKPVRRQYGHQLKDSVKCRGRSGKSFRRNFVGSSESRTAARLLKREFGTRKCRALRLSTWLTGCIMDRMGAGTIL
jgi:hypothetical protein